MTETTIWLLVIVFGSIFYFGSKYFVENHHIARIRLSDMKDDDVLDLINNMLNFHKETQGVSTIPKFKFADLSKEKSGYDDYPVNAFYVYKLKMILFDLNYMRSAGYNIKNLARIVSHEWQHYVDHLQGITYDTAGMEICEMRADKFEVVGMRDIIRNLEM